MRIDEMTLANVGNVAAVRAGLEHFGLEKLFFLSQSPYKTRLMSCK